MLFLLYQEQTLNLQANRRNSQEQVNKDWNRKGNNKNSAWVEQKWGSEYKETGGWISTRAPGEVASASSWKKKPKCFLVAATGLYRGESSQEGAEHETLT